MARNNHEQDFVLLDVGDVPLTLDTVTEAARRRFRQGTTVERIGLPPPVIAAVAGEVDIKGLRFQGVTAEIDDNLLLYMRGTARVGLLSKRGHVVVGNGNNRLHIVDSSVGWLTRRFGDIDGIMSAEMSRAMGPGFSVSDFAIVRGAVTARVEKQSTGRRRRAT
jgi:hypothetical protein